MFEQMTEAAPGAVYGKNGSVRIYVPSSDPKFAVFASRLDRVVPGGDDIRSFNLKGQFQGWWITDATDAVAAVGVLKQFYPDAVVEDYEAPIDMQQRRQASGAERLIFEETDGTKTQMSWDELAAKYRREREERARNDYWERSRPPKPPGPSKPPGSSSKGGEWDRNSGNGKHTPPPPAPKAASPFAVLFLLDTAPEWAVKAMYKAAMKQHHPDNPTTADRSGELAKKINVAFATIKKLKGWT